MILCFGTLLTAMLMKGSDLSLTYTIHIKTFLVVIIGLAACLTFILIHSEKGLKKIIDHLY
jgi:flagellar motor component MotA